MLLECFLPRSWCPLRVWPEECPRSCFFSSAVSAHLVGGRSKAQGRRATDRLADERRRVAGAGNELGDSTRRDPDAGPTNLHGCDNRRSLIEDRHGDGIEAHCLLTESRRETALPYSQELFEEGVHSNDRLRREGRKPDSGKADDL